MSRIVGIGSLAVFLGSLSGPACNGSGPSGPDPALPSTWIKKLSPWYCGVEALPPTLAKDGTPKPQSRNVSLRIVPAAESFTAIFAAAHGNYKSVGSLTKFVVGPPGSQRAASLSWANDTKQKGDALLAFSPDYSAVTVTWTLTSNRPGGLPVPPAPTTLAAAASSADCATGSMIR